jgi:hypothetical protein
MKWEVLEHFLDTDSKDGHALYQIILISTHAPSRAVRWT